MSAKFTFIDLFAGLGGFRLACESLGGKCVFSSEIDKFAANTYELNFGEKPAGDITKISSDQIPDHDLLCAGFPCQPFSIGGKRLGFADTRGTLFFEVERILRDKQPKAFFLENVAGLKSHDQGNTLKVIETALVKLGYVFTWQVLNAKDIGFPQNRNRWYCVGIRKELLTNTDLLINELNHEICKLNFTFPKSKPLLYTLESLIELTDSSVLLSENVDDYKKTEDPYAISSTAQSNIQQYLPSFINSPRYNKEFLVIASEIRKSRCNFRADGISPCLTAKMGTGGNNIPVLVAGSRKLTERECLRIMGYPDTYLIKPNYSQSYKQIGNSVVVPVITEIAAELLKLLKKLNVKL